MIERRMRIALSVVAFAALAASSVTYAGDGVQEDAAPSLAVAYGDLDVKTEAGTRTLYRRLQSAARRVCPDTHSRDLAAAVAGRQCVRAAVSRAVQDVAAPRLVQLHEARQSRG